MRPGVLFSGLLHVAAILVMIFGLPRFFSRPEPEPQALAVQLVVVADQTRATQNNPNPVKDAPVEVTQPAPEPPKPDAKPTPPTPAPPPPSAAAPPPPPTPPEPKPTPPAPQPAAAPAPPPPPEPKPPEPKPTPPPPPPPAPSPLPPPPPPPPPKPPEPKPEPPKPDVRPDPKPTPPPPTPKPAPRKPDAPKPAKDDQSFDAMLRNLTKSASTPSDQKPDRQRTQTASAAQPSSMPNAPIGAKLTTAESDLIAHQLANCWNIPAGAKDATGLRPELRLTLDANGDTVRAEILDTGKMADPFWRAAAESARRAALNPQCRHLQIPSEKLRSSGNTITVTFDPRDVL